MRAVDVALPGDLLAALGIDLGKRFEILVERGTHGAIGVVVAPFAARGGADLDSAANQFLAEFDELFDALLEDRQTARRRRPGRCDSQFLTTARICSLNLSRPSPIFLHDGRFRRHVDAAGFHHDRIDQRIDALDIECGAAGGLDRLREFRVPAGVVVGQYSNRGGQERESVRRSNTAWPRAKAGTQWRAGRGCGGFHVSGMERLQ